MSSVSSTILDYVKFSKSKARIHHGESVCACKSKSATGPTNIPLAQLHTRSPQPHPCRISPNLSPSWLRLSWPKGLGCVAERGLSPEAPVSEVRQSQVETGDASPATQPFLTKKAISWKQAHKVVHEQDRILGGDGWGRPSVFCTAKNTTCLRRDMTGHMKSAKVKYGAGRARHNLSRPCNRGDENNAHG